MSLKKKQQVRLLKLIHTCPANVQKELLNKIPVCGIHAVCEAVHNCLKGHIRLTKHQKSKLRPHKHTLRQLVRKDLSLATKRKLIVQKGGFLNVLIPAALSVLTSLISHGSR